jgi:hypothetical protein
MSNCTSSRLHGTISQKAVNFIGFSSSFLDIGEICKMGTENRDSECEEEKEVEPPL